MEASTSGKVAVTGLRTWQGVINSLMLPLRYAVRNADSFEAAIEAQSVGGIRMFNVWAQPHQVTRSEDLLARPAEPIYTISTQIEGHSLVEQHGRTSRLAPGDLVVYDSTAPWIRSFGEQSHTFVIMFPQHLITLPPGALAQISGLRIAGDAGFGRIVSRFLHSVSEDLPAVTGRVGLSVTKSLVDMVSSAFSETLEVVTPFGSFSELELSVRIRDSIMERLGDPELRPATIAAEHFISVRKLHSIFQSQGTTVSTWIRERRLEMSRRSLADHRNTDSIAEIAKTWGLSDATHFSKLFREIYGTTPREYRARAHN